MRYLILILSLFMVSCSNNENKDDAKPESDVPLSFDGIYSTAQRENENTGDKYRYFLRFYEDGTVISVTSSGKASDIKGWFKKGHENVNEGEYEVDNAKISFTTSGKYGEVSYKGTIEDLNTLKLRSKSSANDNEEKLVFFLADE